MFDIRFTYEIHRAMAVAFALIIQDRGSRRDRRNDLGVIVRRRLFDGLIDFWGFSVRRILDFRGRGRLTASGYESIDQGGDRLSFAFYFARIELRLSRCMWLRRLR